MNTKNKTFAILFDASIASVAKNIRPLQLSLFGLGYEWNLPPRRAQTIKFPSNPCVMYLNTEAKTLSWDREYIGKSAVVSLSYANIRLTGLNLLEVIETVENPPKPAADKVQVEEVRGNYHLSFIVDTIEKSLEVVAQNTNGGDVFMPISSESITKVAKAMGILSNTLPVVRFLYPSSTTGRIKNRIVRVTFMNDEYIRGYELEDVNADMGIFKAFQRKRVKDGNVAILSFHDDK